MKINTSILFLVLFTLVELTVIFYIRKKQLKPAAKKAVICYLYIPLFTAVILCMAILSLSSTVYTIDNNEEHEKGTYIFTYTDKNGKSFSLAPFTNYYCNVSDKELRTFKMGYGTESLHSSKDTFYPPHTFGVIVDEPDFFFTTPLTTILSKEKGEIKVYLDYSNIVYIQDMFGYYKRIEVDE